MPSIRPCEPLIQISGNIGHTSNEIGHRGHNEVSRQVGIPPAWQGIDEATRKDLSHAQ